MSSSLKIKTDDVIYRKDLYPRFEPDQNLITIYSNSVDNLPPIKLNQNHILIDGYHRWKAHQTVGKNEIEVEIVETESEAELEILAYRLNSNHGKQLAQEEKRIFALKKAELLTNAEIGEIVSVSESTVGRWTKERRKQLDEQRNQKIVELYLKAEYTQEKIAEIFEIDQSIISRVINDSMQKMQTQDLHKDFKPFLYNIWNLPKADKETDHFGYFPETFMENLLYYQTQPMGIVYDPFAGSGTTVDVCKRWLRRYYCSDMKVKPGREEDIKEWKIQDGLPEDLPKPAFVFLDPPYWIQAEGKYSDSQDDLGNITLDEFYKIFCGFLDVLKKRQVPKIAIVIQPTQYKNDMNWEDHIFKFHEVLFDKYSILMRYILPYSTEQYLPQMVIKAKDEKICLGTHRDLIVWGRNND